ncbi:MAG TPA: hypothetical protein VGJ59_02875, partial [Jatrophihabitantaceae bacterium]
KAIAALRKPTRSAWTLNALARADAGLIERAAELGTRLRDAERRLDGAALRELSRERRELVDAMARAAFAATGQHAPSAALREDVNATLTAAFADPEVAEQLASGRLLRAAQWAGFGLDAGARADLSVVPAAAPARPVKATSPPRPGPPAKAKPREPTAAERAHRERVAAAEKEVVTARRQLVKAETEAAKHRDRVEALEQQLGDAHHRLTEAGHRVRDAKADLRRATQRLDRATSTR